MKIKMLTTRKGVEGDFFMKQYYKDITYDVTEKFGKQFCAKGWAIEIKDEADE